MGDLQHTQLTDKLLSAVSDVITSDLGVLNKIEEIDVSRNFITPIGAQSLLNCMVNSSTITKLVFNKNSLGNKTSHLHSQGIGPVLHKLLITSRCLRELHMSSNGIGDADMKYIADGLCET